MAMVIVNRDQYLFEQQLGVVSRKIFCWKISIYIFAKNLVVYTVGNIIYLFGGNDGEKTEKKKKKRKKPTTAKLVVSERDGLASLAPWVAAQACYYGNGQ